MYLKHKFILVRLWVPLQQVLKVCLSDSTSLTVSIITHLKLC